MITCSPLSSTLVERSGYDLLILRRPESIFGNSDGAIGSIATFSTDCVICLIGRKMYRSSSTSVDMSVAVFVTEASTPPIKTRLPAGASSTGTKYLMRYCKGFVPGILAEGGTDRDPETHMSSTVALIMSSSSSGEYPSPSTLTCSPLLSVPL